MDITKKKEEIASRLAKMRHVETPREQEIREINESVKKKSMQMLAKSRHERRHNRGPRTSLEERKKWMAMMSKD